MTSAGRPLDRRRRGACREPQALSHDQLDGVPADLGAQTVAAGMPRQSLGGREEIEVDQPLPCRLAQSRCHQRPQDQPVADLGVGEVHQPDRLAGVDAQARRLLPPLDLHPPRRWRRRTEHQPPACVLAQGGGGEGTPQGKRSANPSGVATRSPDPRYPGSGDASRPRPASGRPAPRIPPTNGRHAPERRPAAAGSTRVEGAAAAILAAGDLQGQPRLGRCPRRDRGGRAGVAGAAAAVAAGSIGRAGADPADLGQRGSPRRHPRVRVEPAAAGRLPGACRPPLGVSGRWATDPGRGLAGIAAAGVPGGRRAGRTPDGFALRFALRRPLAAAALREDARWRLVLGPAAPAPRPVRIERQEQPPRLRIDAGEPVRLVHLTDPEVGQPAGPVAAADGGAGPAGAATAGRPRSPGDRPGAGVACPQRRSARRGERECGRADRRRGPAALGKHRWAADRAVRQPKAMRLLRRRRPHASTAEAEAAVTAPPSDQASTAEVTTPELSAEAASRVEVAEPEPPSDRAATAGAAAPEPPADPAPTAEIATPERPAERASRAPAAPEAPASGWRRRRLTHPGQIAGQARLDERHEAAAEPEDPPADRIGSAAGLAQDGYHRSARSGALCPGGSDP